MLETQASSYAADVDRCLSASYRENLQNVLGCFRDGEVLSRTADTVAQEEMGDGFYFIFAKRSHIVGADTKKTSFMLKTSAELNAFGNV